MSKQPGIPEEQLRACLQDKYELYPVTLEFLPIGKDYNAGVYRVVNEQGRASLLKVTSRSLDVASCLVPHYLRNQGITSVVAPIPTRSGALWTKIGDWTAIVYLWWLLGTSVHESDGCALDCFMFLGAVACTDQRIQEPFSSLPGLCGAYAVHLLIW